MWKLLFQRPFGSEGVKGSQTLLMSAQQHFYAKVPSMLNKVRCVWCLLVASEVQGLSFNTLTADDMYFCHNREKFCNKFQPRNLKNQKCFWNFYCVFVICLILWAFEKKDDLDNFNISGVIDSQKSGCLNAPKLLFQNTLWR